MIRERRVVMTLILPFVEGDGHPPSAGPGKGCRTPGHPLGVRGCDVRHGPVGRIQRDELSLVHMCARGLEGEFTNCHCAQSRNNPCSPPRGFPGDGRGATRSARTGPARGPVGSRAATHRRGCGATGRHGRKPTVRGVRGPPFPSRANEATHAPFRASAPPGQGYGRTPPDRPGPPSAVRPRQPCPPGPGIVPDSPRGPARRVTRSPGDRTRTPLAPGRTHCSGTRLRHTAAHCSDARLRRAAVHAAPAHDRTRGSDAPASPPPADRHPHPAPTSSRLTPPHPAHAPPHPHTPTPRHTAPRPSHRTRHKGHMPQRLLRCLS
ncbi:hypothetical protein GKJPGBOP_02704 [Streptomyces paromomycinus]|uniref:Uncharacterized protein n=1 Tax=Streptomyces paromomycinus TaxID=92743 RepID=A0A401W116_STREY|nr:hypothetical protein GKJPGBOP_02704 [Streptomyces paromomycinus]